jgi:hypothetical protein
LRKKRTRSGAERPGRPTREGLAAAPKSVMTSHPTSTDTTVLRIAKTTVHRKSRPRLRRNHGHHAEPLTSREPHGNARLRRALKSLYEDDPNVDAITSEDLAGDYPAVEYTPPGGDYSLDILSRLGEAFRFEDLEWESLMVDGVRVCVATPRMLYRMKRDAVQPQDKVDAQALRERFGLPEE